MKILTITALLLGFGTLLQAADPMLTLMDAGQLQIAANRHRGAAALVFTESRDFPIRHVDGLPARWAPQVEWETARFEGMARPGEFFVFQIGVYALKEAGPIGLTLPTLHAGRQSIPARALRCLSLGGTNHLGQPFHKDITVPAGHLQALWVGVSVPDSAQGLFQGSARLHLGTIQTVEVKISLRVEGAPVAESGDNDAQHLSRLRWLDSTVGQERTLTRPFVPVATQGRTVRVLGRELTLGPSGLPERLTSFFSPANTKLVRDGREILSAPAAFVVEAVGGPWSWRHAFGKLRSTDLEATWSARSVTDGLRLETTGRLDFTGSGEVRLHLVAEHDVEWRDARLELPVQPAAARYFMGLNHPGGSRPQEVHWRWDTRKHQDCFWLGDVSAGFMLRLKDADYLRPPVNIYYAFRPLRLPQSWGNEGRGGVDILQASTGSVEVRAFSGPRRLRRGETLDYVFELYLTPFRTLDTEKQWEVRFIHLGGAGRKEIDDAVANADPARGPNVLNIHHATHFSPYINYPYSGASFPALCALVEQAHRKGLRVRVYYTTREITQNMPELFPLHSMNGEIILPGPGPAARTLLHPKGPHAWLSENLRGDFIPAWEAQVGPPYADLDLSVITTPDSRWNNFYLEGLRWLVEKAKLDGMYIDDTALEASSLRRARRILDRRPGQLIDLHTWNHFNEWAGFANNLTIYMEVLPYLDRLWLGEGFDASAVSADYWLVEMSGIPFGLMSEMLDGAHPWRGLLFGETARLPWSGNPRGIWQAWDNFGIVGSEFLPFFLDRPPVRTSHREVLATTYRKKGRAMIALGSWASAPTEVTLTMDWPALGLDPARARLRAPTIEGLQTEQTWNPGEAIPLAAKSGALLILEEGTALPARTR